MISEFLQALAKAARSLIVGVLTGIVITFFAFTVAELGALNSAFPLLVLLLPLGAYATYKLYDRLGDSYRKITSTAIDYIHDGEAKDAERPRLDVSKLSLKPQMGIASYFAAAISHLTGASVGKEGVGVQIGLSIAELVRRLDEKLLGERKGRGDHYLMCGASAAFAALFGSPVAGTLFGLYFSSPWHMRMTAMLPCLVSSYASVAVAEALGIHRIVVPAYRIVHFSFSSLFVAVVFAFLLGLMARAFVYLIEKFKHLVASTFKKKAMSAVFPALLVMAGYLVIYLLTGKTEYQGLSLSLLYNSINGTGVAPYAFLLNAALIFLSLAAGFQGGEVVPLLVTGATFGYTFASLLGLETGAYAVLGAIGMLSGGTNLPIVCFALGLELFGYYDPALLFIVVAISFLASGHESIYQHQQLRL